MQKKLYILTGILFLVLHLTATSNRAATLTVTNKNNSGAGSLRQKVFDAGNGDTIRFDPALKGSIQLFTEIVLDKNLTIQGPGANVLGISDGGQCKCWRSGERRHRGISKVHVTLAGQSGMTRTALTSAFGYYRFDDVEVGQTYIVSVSSKRFQFAEPARVIHLLEELTDLTFVALPDSLNTVNRK